MVECQDDQFVVANPSVLSKHEASGIKAPRGWFWDFLLHVCTLGLYTPFSLVGRLRDVRRLQGSKIRPWLWFFVPFFPLAQLIALPRLTRYVRKLEIENHLTPWAKSRYVWIVAVLALATFFNLQNRIATPFWLLMPALIAWAGLFTLLEMRINSVKRSLRTVSLGGGKQGYSWWEWVIVVIMVPFTLVFLPYASLGSLGFYDVIELPARSVYEDPGQRFRFPVTSAGWNKVQPGTFASDEAIIELRGPVDDVYAIVYHYDSLTLEELAHDRSSTFYQTLFAARCEEFRRFPDRRLSMAAQVSCKGRQMNMPSMWSSGIIETPDGIFELLVHMNVPVMSFNALEDELLTMTREFDPL